MLKINPTKDEIGLKLSTDWGAVALQRCDSRGRSTPIARFAEGRRRSVMMALAASIFVAACLLVVAAGVNTDMAYAALVAAAIAVGVGECFHTTVLMPLVADLAPPSLRGRYMASMGLSWWVGLALAPTLGTQVLNLSPMAAFLAAAAVALAAAVSALALARRLPDASRLTPRPRGVNAPAPTEPR
jgi:MFS family permease